ncbi:MAG: cupin domain-containing protein [Halobacteriales archaeon]
MPAYRKIAVDDLPDAPKPTRHKQELDEAVGASRFGFNVYVGDPGEAVPESSHRHPDHEELFYVLNGELVVETADSTYSVEAGEGFYVPADPPNNACGAGDQPARFVAVGAPKTVHEGVINQRCEACGGRTDRESERDEEPVVLSCATCGAVTNRFGPGPADP